VMVLFRHGLVARATVVRHARNVASNFDFIAATI
jgi:hypothetical protein